MLHANSFDSPRPGNQISNSMAPEERSVTVRCPAKINLSLAILGRRADGFHDLSSVVAQTDFGDQLELTWAESGSAHEDQVCVEGAAIAAADNSVTRAMAALRKAAALEHGALRARLVKRIPVGAGLGGGSSDAVGVLRAAPALGLPLPRELDWHALAASLGSDCPLFLTDQPVLMEGRGERWSVLPEVLCRRLGGREVILFGPGFPVFTAQAYRRLAAAALYTPAADAAALVEDWIASGALLPPRINDFERLMGDWMPSLAIVLERLREQHRLDARLSGSGSACFVFPDGDARAIGIIKEEMLRAWGDGHWVVEAKMK
jgi:4-diphosphocytidyl-2-C-methyl-D-erythritol kinase